MRLQALLGRLPGTPSPALSAVADAEVAGVQEDSRQLRAGDLFVARRGLASDGKAFLRQAAEAGAVAAIVDEPVESPPLPVFVAADAAAAAGIVAHELRGRPSTRLKVIGVTGTNGKTTTTYLLRSLLTGVGLRCGMTGTCEVDDGRGVRPATMTTPGPVATAGLLGDMADNGCRAAAMEVSSHALSQRRVAGVEFAAAAFTNLTGDHLDFHGTMEAYAEAKARLFMGLAESAVAVVNAGDAAADRMLRHCSARPLRYGVDVSADYAATNVQGFAAGTGFDLTLPGGQTLECCTPLVGRHNVENALCAAALAMEVFDVTPEQVAAALASAAGAPGRLQPIPNDRGLGVFVDYAHTDDALANVLRALRPVTRGRLRVVFGCGGDRDRTKRPRMARVAESLADDVYLTSDNPRTEDPSAILAEIAAGFEGRSRLVEADRRSAIRAAIADAAEGDTVLIAGKGHEDYQIVGTTKHHFDDAEEARAALRDGGEQTV